MRLTFVQLGTYVADAKRLGLTDADQRQIEATLLVRPNAGAVMQGTGGLRKLRYAKQGQGRGKSGGVRICYVHFPAVAQIYLVVAFAKSERSNLSAQETKSIRELLRQIADRLERNRP